MKFEVEKIAKLARLNLKPDECEKLGQDLSHILDYVESLKELDTSNVEPTSHVLDLKDVFRKDEVKTSKVRDEVLEHAPAREGKFFKVPKVIDRS